MIVLLMCSPGPLLSAVLPPATLYSPQIPNGLDPLAFFPAVLLAFGLESVVFFELPCPARPKGFPPVLTRGPPTPTESLISLP